MLALQSAGQNKLASILGDTCTWKEQLEKTRNWNLLSWKVRNQIRKNEVGKFACTLSNYQAVHFRLNFTFEFIHAAGSGDYVEKNEIKILELSIRPLILE